MKALSYQIMLDEPVLASALDGDPNDSESYPYLPGSLLRGALIRRYQQNRGRVADAAADPDFRRLFLDGTCRFLNAYPLINNCRGLPVPRSWYLKKGDQVANGTTIEDFAIDEPSGNQQYQSLPRPFCVPDADSGNAIVHAPAKQLMVHTQRDRKKGRATDQEGAVFRYAALAEGQRFAAAIVCDHDADAAILQDLLTGSVLLGGSRTGGYGRARFQEIREEAATWREVGPRFNELDDDLLTVTLLSPALVRSNRGQFEASLEALVQALNERLTEQERQENPWPQPMTAFLGPEPVGGFNRAWGLPLPQVLACAAGTVLVFSGVTLLDPARKRLEEQGIGERRAEGFGRVAINWSNKEKWEMRLPTSTDAQTHTISSASGLKLAEAMQQRRLRNKLDQAVLKQSKATFSNMSLPGKPNKTQLARLRIRIQAELLKPTPSLQCLADFCTSVNERNAVKSVWERMRFNSNHQSLLEWLREFSIQTDINQWRDRWRVSLGLAGDTVVLALGGVDATLNDTLRVEYALRLIDALLARIIKQGGDE